MIYAENPFSLETDRLILRQFTISDLNAFFSIMKDREVNTFLPVLLIGTIEEAKSYLETNYIEKYKEHDLFHYAVCLKTDNIPIGFINAGSADGYDLGYGLSSLHWNKGIITEAGSRVIEQLKVSGVPYITATHDVNNPRSGRVMEKLGMRYRYSYQEQWQPKNIRVTFRMYQRNLDGQDGRIYMKYWQMHPVHFIEKISNAH